MFSILLSILGFILTIAILVTFHEWGHFYFARLFGVHVKRFSVGFGKPFVTKKSRKHVTELGATEYAIAAIPLGGYVQMAERPMAGEEPNKAEQVLTGAEEFTESIPQGLAFQDKPAWQRALIVSAGPLANFLLAILLFASAYMYGSPAQKPVLGGDHQGFQVTAVNEKPVEKITDLALALATETQQVTLSGHNNNTAQTIILESIDSLNPDPFQKYGIQLWRPNFFPIVDKISADSPAALAGIQSGDRILTLNNQPIEYWQQIPEIVNNVPDNIAIAATVSRDGNKLTLNITPKSITEKNVTRKILGVQLDTNAMANPEYAKSLTFIERKNPIAALQQGFADTWKFTAVTFTVIKQMITGQSSIKNIGGPLTIADGAGASLQSGAQTFIIFLAIISLSLGLLNILPIPMLDGGHLVLIALEKIKGSPVSPGSVIWYNKVGLVLVLSLSLFAIGNDIHRFL
jgi:regulator of sigma E protease